LVKELHASITKISNNVYQNIFESASDGILIIELETLKFKLANKAIASMLGYDIEEIFHLNLEDLHPGNSLSFALEEFERQVKEQAYLSQDLPLKRKDGSTIYADVNTTIVYIGGRSVC